MSANDWYRSNLYGRSILDVIKPPPSFLYGIPIIESPVLDKRSVRVREHSRKPWDRRGRYHARIEKEWKKRFGYREEKFNGFYMIDPRVAGMIGMGDRAIMASPRMAEALRNCVKCDVP